MKKPSCFVAYSSEPVGLAETIEGFIKKIDQGQTVNIRGWKSLKTTGRLIIDTICQGIEQSDIFICDVTTLNHNVLFELGFAIAKNKRTWILLNKSLQKSTEYTRFKLLTTVGYSAYDNSYDIESSFYKEEPYKDLENTIYKDSIKSLISKPLIPSLLYLKCGVNTEASLRLSRYIDKLIIPTVNR